MPKTASDPHRVEPLKEAPLANPKPICRAPGCDKPAIAKRMCPVHYMRMKNYGTFELTTNRAPVGAGERWMQEHKSYAGDECLPYPFCSIRNWLPKYRLTIEARMCLLAHGEPPAPIGARKGQLGTAHSCGNGHLNCLNPKHLRWATILENKADMVKHGTRRRGENHQFTVLTEKEVREIRTLLGTMTQKKIAALYGVHRATIGAIKNRVSWFWLD